MVDKLLDILDEIRPWLLAWGGGAFFFWSWF
jgi:hypothetical protein